jgi:hypothetical protein
MYLPNFSQIFCHRMSGHTLLSASNSISIPRESYKGMSLEMPFGTSELRPNPLKPVSHLGTGALWTTDALSFGRLHCGLYPRSMRVIKFIPLIILNVSSGIGEMTRTGARSSFHKAYRRCSIGHGLCGYSLSQRQLLRSLDGRE